MSSKVTKYTEILLRPLEDLHNSYTQFAAQHRDISGRLHSHASDLLSGTASRFEGMGAKAFEILVNHYLDMVEKQMQIFDDAASAVINCHTLISMATGAADAAGLNDALVGYILGQVTHNDIIQQGSGPIWGVVNDMQRTVSNMGSTGGDLFGNIVHFHFGSAFDDLMQEGGDAKQMASDMMNLLQGTGRVLGQWATSVSDAVRKCLTTIETAAAKALEFAVPLGEIAAETVFTSAEDAYKFITSNWRLIWGSINVGIGLLGNLIKPMGDFLGKATGGMMLLGLAVDILDGQDNTPEKFFSDVNAKFLGLIPVVSWIGLIGGLVSDAGQLEGLAQQHWIAPWLAGGNAALEKELSDSGKALNSDAQGIKLGQVFMDLEDAAYNMDVLGERGDVHLAQKLGQDIMQNPQNIPQDLLHGAPEVELGILGAGTDQNPDAALHYLKKAGQDLGESVVSLGAFGVDLDATELEDATVIYGRISPSHAGATMASVRNENQAWQEMHQPIESFRNWLTKLPTS